MTRSLRSMLMWSMVVLSGCTSPFISSWTAPDAEPLDFSGAKVAAVVMAADISSRKMGEDILAQEITDRGARGISMYTVFPDADPSKEAEAKAALERAGVKGVVVMRPVNIDQEVVSSPSPAYWDGYYGYGWGAPWMMSGDVYTNTIVYVETRVYSLEQNELVWSGQSKTTNPEHVEGLVRDVAGAVAEELENQGLL